MPTKYIKQFYWKDYLVITLGLILYAIGLIGFIKPAGVVTGGLTGIALLIEYATHRRILLQDTYFVVNCLLLLVALKILGFKFLIKTIYGVAFLTIILSVMDYIIKGPVVASEPMLASVIGAMLCGAGIGMVFSVNGSTGGTDIVVAVVNKYKSIAFGRGMLFCDLIIISCSYFVFKDFNKIVAGLIVMGVMTYSIDMVINGFRQSVQFFIISSKHEIIADAINKEIKRGCTVLDGTGWYTKQPIKVLMVLTKRTQSIEMFRLIKSIDDKAFITQSTVRGVSGEGFDHKI